MRPPISPSKKPQNMPQLDESGRPKLFQRALSQAELQNAVEQLLHAGNEKDTLIEQLGNVVMSIQMQFSLLTRCMLDNKVVKQEHVDTTMLQFKLATQTGNLLTFLARPIAADVTRPNFNAEPDQTPDEATRIFGE